MIFVIGDSQNNISMKSHCFIVNYTPDIPRNQKINSLKNQWHHSVAHKMCSIFTNSSTSNSTPANFLAISHIAIF